MNSICRVCLQENDNAKPYSVFTRKMSIMIMKCTTIVISDDEIFPKQICGKCLNNLDIAYEFKILCEKSDRELKRRFLYSIQNDSIKYEHPEENIKVEDVLEETRDPIYNFIDIDQSSETSVDGKSDSAHVMNNVKIEAQIITDLSNKSTLIRKKSRGRPNKQKSEDVNKKIHVCEHCGKSFNLKRALKIHRTRHTGEKYYMCSDCGNAFHSANELRQHSAVHTGDKRYKCVYCDRKFADWGSRLKHERRHRGERPYKCNVCEMDFTYSHVLKRHKMVHSGTKPFKCAHCEQSFLTKYHLDRHNKKLHVILPE